jgi:hypothetical protein
VLKIHLTPAKNKPQIRFLKMMGFMSKAQTESLNKKTRLHLSENQALNSYDHLLPSPGKDG